MHGTVAIGHRHSYANKTAFVLNAHAKRVSDSLVSQLVNVIPTGDLFYSRTFADAENYYRTVLRRGYGQVFSGGGDGTIINTISLLKRIAKEEGIHQLPHIGVLRLGTGNALASIASAGRPFSDVNHVVRGGKFDTRPLDLIECDNGGFTPFAGLGYDSEILDDYMQLKKAHEGTVLAPVVKTVLGYLWAGIMRTAPRNFKKETNHIRIFSKSAAYKMVYIDGEDREIKIPAGTLLFEGPAPAVCVGSIPYVGYGLKMFPHVGKKDGFMQLRVYDGSIWSILMRLYPGVWNGTCRHKNLHDFLVQDVQIACEKPLPYQIAGDVMGLRSSVSFKAAPRAVNMAVLARSKQKEIGRASQVAQIGVVDYNRAYESA